MFARLVVALAAVAPLASSTDEAGKAWLAEKATEAGVISLPSGLMYKVIKDGAAAGSFPRAFGGASPR